MRGDRGAGPETTCSRHLKRRNWRCGPNPNTTRRGDAHGFDARRSNGNGAGGWGEQPRRHIAAAIGVRARCRAAQNDAGTAAHANPGRAVANLDSARVVARERRRGAGAYRRCATDVERLLNPRAARADKTAALVAGVRAIGVLGASNALGGITCEGADRQDGQQQPKPEAALHLATAQQLHDVMVGDRARESQFGGGVYNPTATPMHAAPRVAHNSRQLGGT